MSPPTKNRPAVEAELALPFFAYGIFRHGEIAYPTVEPYVAHFERSTTKGRLLERDGLYLLDLDGDDEVAGDLLHFRPALCRAAYAAVDALEPRHVYKWATCDAATAAGRHRARALVGRSPRRGSHVPDGPYRSRDDPLFVEAVAEIEAVLRPDQAAPPSEISDFFRLQMAYLLLWAAIERFCTLRWGFGQAPVERVSRLADEPAFATALKRHVSGTRRVFRADRPSDSAATLDHDPSASLAFYYQVRSNVARRGKTIYAERELIRASLEELSRVFTDVLDDTLGRPSH